MQAYLYLGSGVDDVVASLGLRAWPPSGCASRWSWPGGHGAHQHFWTNPAAVKRCYDTGGLSVWQGAVNLARDMVRNHGMPSMVDRRPFKLGENLAISPGAVIHRSEVFD